MDTKITPLPWEQDGLRISAENGSAVNIALCAGVTTGQNWSGSDYATDAHAEANVAFIVRAVNSHAQLVEALQLLLREEEAGTVCEIDRQTARAALAAAGA